MYIHSTCTVGEKKLSSTKPNVLHREAQLATGGKIVDFGDHLSLLDGGFLETPQFLKLYWVR